MNSGAPALITVIFNGRKILYWLALWGLSLEGVSQAVNQINRENEQGL